MIQIQQLRKQFGEKVAVDIDNFHIKKGDMLGLVGNNGAGKTTLFRLILDLLNADTGDVQLTFNPTTQPEHPVATPQPTALCVNPALSEEWKQYTGAYIDEGFLIDFLTPDEYFAFIARVCGVPEVELEERLKPYQNFMAGELLGQKKLIRDLSAGNKQKVGIVAALINRPQLLILDEPFNFLDPTSQHQLKQLLGEYHRQYGATMLISSHNIDHTTHISTRIALMENGRILQDIDNHHHEAAEILARYFNVEPRDMVEQLSIPPQPTTSETPRETNSPSSMPLTPPPYDPNRMP